MYGSLFWIEWLDRLDRILSSTRDDVATLSRSMGPRSFAALERSNRQLSALTSDLRLLDRAVLPSVGNLQRALDTTLFHLGNLVETQGGAANAAPDRMLIAVSTALRDSVYEAALLVEPEKRRL